jgi:D-glycero-alpha-D-manno-heptose-7-phosphate kinase
MYLSKTPYRLSFFGGASDYPAWYLEHGGAVINTSIDKYCYISLRKLPPFFEHKHRVVWSIIENVKEIDEIQHPAVRECFRYMNVKEGLEIHHDGDLPARSGIGSSSAFAVGLLNVLHNYRNDPISKYDLALEAIHVEQDLKKDIVGCQDQLSCGIGGFNYMEFSKDKPKVTPINNDVVKQLEACLLLVFTGFPHTASDIAQTYEFKENEINEMSQLTQEALKILKGGCILDFGKLLHESWTLKKRLSDKISSPYIDYIYKLAMDNGAIGGKVNGAGGAGFMTLFCEPDKQNKVKSALNGLLFVPFKFEKTGTQIIINNGDW